MDLQEQLKKLFPDHEVSNEPEIIEEKIHELLVQKEPMICKFEKRKGKPTTIIEGYEGEEEDFKKIVVDMFKELNTERTVLKNKLQDLESIVVDLKAESSILLELIKVLTASKHELSGKVETKDI
jgi:translation initiation factor 1 (eIF-1/SUI1)